MKTTGAERRPWLAATLWMAILGPYFFVVYGTCNWVSSQQPDVPSFFWEWERHIPFVPLLIVPYMSIDLFYAASTWMCRTRRELHTLAARILFAISASGICFLLFPLRFAFVRPQVDGVLGMIFAPLNANDLPYNLAPSLHISLRAILWGVYGRHLFGKTRVATKICFILIGLSTVLIWQHHLIDVIAGFAMALITFYVFPDREQPPLSAGALPRGHRRPDFAAMYAIGSALLFAAGFLLLPGGALLFWPATALALVAGAYAGLGAAVFQKNHGAISAAAEWILLPWLAAQAIVRLIWKGGKPWADLDEHVRFGRRVAKTEARQLAEDGVVAVLDLGAESTECRWLVEHMEYRQLSILDFTAPTPEALHTAVDFIRQQSRRGRVYLHCELGYSRSAIVAAAWALASGAAQSSTEAIAMVRAKRPEIRIGERSRAALEAFARNLAPAVPATSSVA